MVAIWLICLFTAVAPALANVADDGTLTRDSAALGDCLGAQGYDALPLRRGIGPHLEVIARINGVPGRFLVDTGAQITVVNAPSLPRFHLSAVKTGVRVYGAVGGPGERIRAALASNLKIGPCEASPFLLGVSDLTALNQGRRPVKDGQFDGIIGADVLQSFSFVIDCAGLRLYAKAPDAGSNTIPQPAINGFMRDRGYSEVEMQRYSISDFEVQANVNGRKALWLVDTGAAITLLDTAISRRAGVKLNPTQFTVGGAGGGRRKIDIGVVDNLRLSSLRVRSAVIAISDISANNAALQEKGKPPIDGYLGADFLKDKAAVIDCAQMRLYLRN
jgi:predicted aspartyl protease